LEVHSLSSSALYAFRHEAQAAESVSMEGNEWRVQTGAEVNSSPVIDKFEGTNTTGRTVRYCFEVQETK